MAQASFDHNGQHRNPHKTPHSGEFLPNLCTVSAVFHLVLVGELLAFALALGRYGVAEFSWYGLGILSMLIQWIVLSSAACLCPLRPWFKRQSPTVAGASSYLIVMAITVAFTLAGTFLRDGQWQPDWNILLTNLLLAALFAGIVLRYFYLQQQLRNQQQAELNARIQALQSRIRPHFLFNSMNSIASLIDFDPVAAERMVVDLSDLFRASLNEPGLIPLEREIELCQRFAGIEQVRIGDRLTMDWQLDLPSDASIPSLLLQPLVENAIYHGVQPLTEGGTVTVKIEHDNRDCLVTITNPLGDNRQASNKGNGMALENIRHRLEAHYGRRGTLSSTSDGNVYRVEVRFPLDAGS